MNNEISNDFVNVSVLNFQRENEKKSRRVGRGHGSGNGKTAGKGHKGQKARSGGSIRWGFEGGQMPLQRRIPKRGFTNKFAKKVVAVDVGRLKIAKENVILDADWLVKNSIVKGRFDKIKLIGSVKLEKGLKVKVNGYSASARRSIEECGGIAEVI